MVVAWNSKTNLSRDAWLSSEGLHNISTWYGLLLIINYWVCDFCFVTCVIGTLLLNGWCFILSSWCLLNMFQNECWYTNLFSRQWMWECVIKTCFIISGFSNWKKVAGGNWKVAGALSNRDNGSLVEWGEHPTPSAERNRELPLWKFWKSGCLD